MSEIKKQASNIDEQGNVLYLDAERLKRKEKVFTPYRRPKDGLGIFNFVKENITALKNGKWGPARLIYRTLDKYSVWMKKGGARAKIYKRITMLAPERDRHTGSIMLPLNVDLTPAAEKVTVPMELLKEGIRNTTFIGGMDACLCRECNGCEEYPHDIACLFLGEAGRNIVKNRMGRELTVEEALARVDKAAEHGLMAQAVWVEVEQWLWGLRNGQMDKFIEICFCCSCCCIALKLSRNATDADRHRFHPAGWTAVPDRTKCVGCGKCVEMKNGCPMEAITMGEDGKVVIDQEKCLGCGICAARCKLDAIHIKQTMPMRENLEAYFREEFNMDLKVWKTGESEE